MNDNLIDVKTLRPLTRFIYTIGELPSSYLMSMTYEEQLIWLCNYLEKTVIPTINNNGNAVSELQNLYIELKNYVDNYFDQNMPELVDEALQKLVDNGTLENLINDVLHLVKIYDTEAEMLLNKNSFVDGMTIKTLGKSTINDNGGAIFKIYDETPTGEYINLNNGLYAKYINNIMYNYYDDITVEKARYHDTDCYITTIPMNDKHGNMIKPFVGYSATLSPSEYARANNTTLTTNASLAVKTTNNGNQIPSIISNGVIIRDHDLINEGVATNVLYLGIKADRSITEYPVATTAAQTMINDGVIQAFDVYWKLVENGVALDLSDYYTNEGLQANDVRGPRQTLGIKNDGTLIFLTCDGRTQPNLGLLSSEQQEIMIALGCVNAWNLDGGGSTSTTYLGTKINRNIDNHGTKDRQIPYTLNFKSVNVNKETADIYSQIGKVKQEIVEQLLPDVTENKVRSLIVINGRDFSGDTPINEFYFPSLGRITGSENSNELIELVKKDESDSYYSYFKIKKVGYFLISFKIEIITRSVQQNRIDVYRVNENYQIPGSNMGASSTLATAQRLEICCDGFINNRNVNNVYACRIKAPSTATVNAGSVMIEEM